MGGATCAAHRVEAIGAAVPRGEVRSGRENVGVGRSPLKQTSAPGVSGLRRLMRLSRPRGSRCQDGPLVDIAFGLTAA